ncbi:MAG: hypothetical protein VKN83_07430 [Cyanobacteriota bacterium]|nr:hypothetical protein [Cyanobacteriota bacterium]
MARGEPPRPGSQLPAPYRNPWSALAEALRSVLADQRLALQRLWRRNREGELWIPGFWPRDLAPLFWPLLLAFAMALMLGLGSRLLGALHPPRTAQTPPPAGLALPAERQPSSQRQAPALADTTEPQAAGRIAPLQPPATFPIPAPAPDAAGAGMEPSGAGQEQAGPGTPDTENRATDDARTTAPALRLDPLLELLSQGEDARLLLAARPDPAGSRLSLTLSEAAEALPQAKLLAWARRLQQRAREEGYERLELRDRQGRLRARSALVGSGMILLAPAPDA